MIHAAKFYYILDKKETFYLLNKYKENSLNIIVGGHNSFPVGGVTVRKVDEESYFKVSKEEYYSNKDLYITEIDKDGLSLEIDIRVEKSV